MERGTNSSLRRSVYERLKEEILAGHYMPNERLIEADIAQKFGVSRTPVREVLRMLELEGLIANRDHYGAQVVSISPQEVRQLYEIRVALEGWAARLAAERATPEQISAIDASVQQLFTGASGDPRGLVRIGSEFHHRVASAAGNDSLVKYLQQIRTHLSLFRMTALSTQQRLEAVKHEYRGIVEAIRARDPDRAEALAREHARMAMEIAIANLEVIYGGVAGLPIR